MAFFTLATAWKKSVSNLEVWEKDGKEIRIEEAFRWGNVELETEGDDVPVIDLQNENDLDPFMDLDEDENKVIEVQPGEQDDQVYYEITFSDNVDEDEQEKLREFIQDEGAVELESEGWIQMSLDTTFVGPLVLLDADGNEIARGE